MVISHWKAKCAALVEERPHLRFYLRRDGREGGVILLPKRAHHGGTARRDGSHEQIRRWPLDHHRPAVDADLAESGLFDQSPEPNAVAQRKPRQHPSLSSNTTLQGTLNRRVRWAVLRGAPARDPESSAGPEDPPHLAKGLEPIGEKLEALLTEDEIKDALIEGQALRLRREPSHVRTTDHCVRDRQHGRIDIE